jgi:hypothetical protein
MNWIKRNLFFVIGAVVSLALLGFAGFYTYRGWKHNADAREELNKAYEELKRLNNQALHPGFGKVDNIKAAQEQRKQIRELLVKAAKDFEPVPPILGAANVTSSEFQAALRRTVEQLTREAANASVLLPQDYKFSFYQQFRLLNFAPGSLEPLARQLSEVKALCDVLIRAKVNHIDLVQRERVSADDAYGPQTDYVDMASQSNELAVLSPYQITFRSFSPEIAKVLSGFANSRHGFIVQSMDVRPATDTGMEQPGIAPGMPYPSAAAPTAPAIARAARMAAEEAAERAAARPDLYGAGTPAYTPPAYTPPAYTPTPGYTPAPGYPAPVTRPGAGGAQIVLNERPLRIVLVIQVVKMFPNK